MAVGAHGDAAAPSEPAPTAADAAAVPLPPDAGDPWQQKGGDPWRPSGKGKEPGGRAEKGSVREAGSSLDSDAQRRKGKGKGQKKGGEEAVQVDEPPPGSDPSSPPMQVNGHDLPFMPPPWGIPTTYGPNMMASAPPPGMPSMPLGTPGTSPTTAPGLMPSGVPAGAYAPFHAGPCVHGGQHPWMMMAPPGYMPWMPQPGMVSPSPPTSDAS